mgnify:FL=1
MELRPETLSAQLETWINETREALVGDLMELTRIPSVACAPEGPFPYGEACGRVLEKGGEIAGRRGLVPRNHENHCVTITIPGKSERTIGIFCHLDVVPAGSNWQSAPYAPFERDGYIFGRGVTDNKGPAAAMLSLLDFLQQKQVAQEHTLMLYLGGNEEAGMEDLDWYLAHMPPPELALTPDARFPVCRGEKGHLTAEVILPLPAGVASFEGGSASNAVPDRASIVLRRCKAQRLQAALDRQFSIEETTEGVRISASGRSAHAASPEAGENAIVKLCQALLASDCLDSETARILDAYTDLFGDCYGAGFQAACEDEPSGRLTAVGGVLRTVGSELVQTLDIRYPVTVKSDWLRERVACAVQQAGFSLCRQRDSQPLYFPEGHPFITMLDDAFSETLGRKLEPYVIGGGTYARKLPMAAAYGHLLPGRPRPGGRGRGGGHQADECVSVEGLEDLMRVYLHALLRLDHWPI